MLTAIKNPAFQKSMIQNIALVLCCVLLLSVFMISNTSVAFCNEKDGTTEEPAAAEENKVLTDDEAVAAITKGITDLATKGYTIMLVIACPIVAVMFALAGFQIIGGGPQGIQKGKGTIINACIGLAIIAFAPILARSVAQMLANNFTKDLNSYNPFK